MNGYSDHFGTIIRIEVPERSYSEKQTVQNGAPHSKNPDQSQQAEATPNSPSSDAWQKTIEPLDLQRISLETSPGQNYIEVTIGPRTLRMTFPCSCSSGPSFK